MGFIEETGAAQYYRDARITPIYEGTNGIQAIDLLGRKLSLHGGAAVRSFLDEVKQTVGRCASGAGAVQSIGGELAAALAACEAATAWLQQCMRTSPNQALPGATPFLRMMGLLAGAHYLAIGALAAEEQLTRSGADKPFLTARIAVAQFFAEQILPQAAGLLGPVTRGASGPFALSGDEIGN